jgi:glyoxylase I family protein
MHKDSPFLVSGVHHIAIICSDYPVSKKFYTQILGFEILREVYREERDSWKLDLAINGHYQIELFSFPNTPKRPSQPEACGLRHLALKVADIVHSTNYLENQGIACEPLRIDPYTGKRFTFFSDPDGLPIEFYEDN